MDENGMNEAGLEEALADLFGAAPTGNLCEMARFVHGALTHADACGKTERGSEQHERAISELHLFLSPNVACFPRSHLIWNLLARASMVLSEEPELGLLGGARLTDHGQRFLARIAASAPTYKDLPYPGGSRVRKDSAKTAADESNPGELEHTAWKIREILGTKPRGDTRPFVVFVHRVLRAIEVRALSGTDRWDTLAADVNRLLRATAQHNDPLFHVLAWNALLSTNMVATLGPNDGPEAAFLTDLGRRALAYLESAQHADQYGLLCKVLNDGPPPIPPSRSANHG